MPLLRHAWTIAAPLLTLALATPRAFAQTAPGAAEFEKGMQSFRTQECAAAVAPLEFASRAASQPSALMALGFCYRQLKEFSNAIDAYQRFLELHSDDGRRALVLLEQTTEEEREWRRNHPEPPRIPDPSRNPEPPRSEAPKAAGADPTTRLDARPIAPRSSGVPAEWLAPHRPPKTDDLVVGDSKKRSPLSLVILGAGVGAGGVGTYFGFRNRSAMSNSNAAQTAAARADARSQAQSAATVATVSWVAAGVFLATGLAILLFTDL